MGRITDSVINSGNQLHDELVKKNLSLVKRIAQHMLSRLSSCVQLDDLVQSGMIGLLEAARNYDVKKGASFETYASIRIRGSMLDEIRKGDWVPRSVHRNARRLAEAMREIENKNGRDARNNEVAQSLNISLDEYHRLLQESTCAKMYQFSSEGINEENISSDVHMSTPSPFEKLQRDDFKKSLAKGIESLPERERMILNLYYDEELNLRQVGEVLGVSESRVSQIHSQAVVKLKTRLREWRQKER